MTDDDEDDASRITPLPPQHNPAAAEPPVGDATSPSRCFPSAAASDGGDIDIVHPETDRTSPSPHPTSLRPRARQEGGREETGGGATAEPGRRGSASGATTESGKKVGKWGNTWMDDRE